MKFAILMIIVVCLQVNARAFSQTISIRVQQADIEAVMKEIQQQSGYSFIYDNQFVEHAKPVTLLLKDASIRTAMQALSKDQSFTFEISDRLIYLKNKPKVSLQIEAGTLQDNLTGRVTDSLGNPLTGVTVVLKDPALYTSTNKEGYYNFEGVATQSTLQFAFLGYRTLVVPVQGRREVNVILQEAIQTMDEVVVTGIFERKESSYTGSAQTISGEELKRVGNANVFQALKNISPSMVLDNFEMGSNPNAMPEIQIRGTSSFPVQQTDLTAGLKGNYLKNPNEPLFILDGFETTVERVFDLDLNRIESITILKDAASKALYGSKGANGVIVIETKKIPSNKPLVSYNSSLDIEMPDLSSYHLTNALQKLEAERIDGMYTADPLGFDAPGHQLALTQLYNQRRKLALEGLDTYWLAKPLQNGVGQKHAISLELGSNDLRVIGDVAYRDVSGAMIGSSRKNLSGSISASYRLKNLIFRNIMSVVDNHAVESPYGTFGDYAKMNPYWRATNPDGSIPFYAEIGPDDEKFTNPFYNSTVNSKNTSGYFNFTNNFYLEWTMLPGLKATSRIGIDVKNSQADEFYPAGHTRFDSYSDEDALRRGSYQVNNGKSSYLSGDLNVNYSKTIDKHFYFANVGFNISERNFNELVYAVEGFASDQMDDISFGRDYALDSRPVGISGISRDIGFLAAASYMWDERFLSDFTFRTNASSQFGADKRWAKFWSVGLGWNIHNEVFLKNLDWVERLKIRGSVGSTGNQNFNTNASIATYAYYLGSLYQGFPGSHVMNMANPGLQWESKFDYNAGLDLSLKKLNLRFDYYVSYTENLLTDITIPNSTGFNSVKDNLGRVKNQGIELYASYLVWAKDRNFFNVHFGIETNRNKIVELSNAMKAYNDRMDALAADRSNGVPVKKYQDGMSMNAIWAVPSRGIDPATGNEIYVKQDGNTSYNWNARDMVVAGVSMPAYQGVFGFNAEYNRIGLSVTARYLGGGQMYNYTLVERVENVDMAFNVDERVLTGRWLYPGQHAQFKRLGTFDRLNPNGSTSPVKEMTRATTRFVQDRRELTIAAANLYYDFNPAMIRKWSLERLRIGVNMNEIAQFSSIQIERGLDYPFARTVSFSLSATF